MFMFSGSKLFETAFCFLIHVVSGFNGFSNHHFDQTSSILIHRDKLLEIISRWRWKKYTGHKYIEKARNMKNLPYVILYDCWTQRLELVLQTTCLIFDVIWLLEWRYSRSSFVLDANLPEYLLSSGNTSCCPSLQHLTAVPRVEAGILCSGNCPLQRAGSRERSEAPFAFLLPPITPPSPYHRSICVDSLRDTDS